MRELRQLRRLAGVTQHALAKSAKIDRVKICLAESGYVKFTKEEKQNITDAFLDIVQERIALLKKILKEKRGLSRF